MRVVEVAVARFYLLNGLGLYGPNAATSCGSFGVYISVTLCSALTHELLLYVQLRTFRAQGRGRPAPDFSLRDMYRLFVPRVLALLWPVVNLIV